MALDLRTNQLFAVVDLLLLGVVQSAGVLNGNTIDGALLLEASFALLVPLLGSLFLVGATEVGDRGD